MPVDSTTTTIVFCEGKPDSLDYLLLSRILPIGPIRIRLIGGKFSLRAYIEGYLATYPLSSQPAYIAFRDRDFDFEPIVVPTAELIRLPGGKPIWLTYRAAIENYLIDADLIHQYWKARETAPGWGHGLAPPIDEIETHIQTSARQLVDYQAVRWGLAKLKPDLRWPEISTSWTREGSGHLPPSLDYNDCFEQACKLVESFQDQVQHIDQELLQNYSDSYRERFSKESFFQERGYLTWFHGKDHLTLVGRSLAPNFPRRSYAEWAAEHIDVTRHLDLQQLVNFTNSLIA